MPEALSGQSDLWQVDVLINCAGVLQPFRKGAADPDNGEQVKSQLWDGVEEYVILDIFPLVRADICFV